MDLTATLRDLEAELHHPGQPCSIERLEVLLHPSFHEVGRSGVAYDRATVLGFLAAQRDPPDVVASGHDVRQLSEDCALLTYESVHRQSGNGPDLHALRSSVWVRTAVGWQLIYHQGTPKASA